MYTLCIASLACDAHARMPIPLGLYRQSLLRQKLRESNEDFFFFLGKERRYLQVCLYQVLILDSQTKTKTKKDWRKVIKVFLICFGIKIKINN